MTSVLITPEYLLNPCPAQDMLREAGFEIRLPKIPQFARGLCSEEQTIDQLHGVAATIAGGERYTKRVLEASPALRVIARSGVGYDRVDLAVATRRNIVVTITPTANHESVAEHAMALLFASAKSIVLNDTHTRAGRWPRDCLKPVRGRTLGIVGLGRIGRSMALRAKAMGMKVVATDKYPDTIFAGKHHVELTDFETLLGRCEYISIHCPLDDETHHLFDANTIAKMRRGSVLINTARGEIVEESALLESLRSGHLRGAGLDVLEQEPPSPENPLLALDNVVFSPHVGGSDETAAENMGIESAQCIIKLSRGEWPSGAVVNNELKSTWRWPQATP